MTYSGGGCSSLCKPTLQESSPGSADWNTLLAGLSHPSQSRSAQFANSGSALLLALYGNEAAGVSAQAQLYRSTDNGSNWTLMSDPCSGKLPSASTREANLISLAATGGIFHRPLQSPQWLHYFHGSLDRCWQAMVICWKHPSSRSTSAHCSGQLNHARSSHRSCIRCRTLYRKAFGLV